MSSPVLIVASASPRRHELLSRFGRAFDVRPADVDESSRPGEDADALVRRLAVAKGEAGLSMAEEPDVVALAADTVVVVDGEILGKPTDATDAARMLRVLSGRSHRVLTGVAVARRTAPEADPADGGAAAALAPAVSMAVEVVATDVTFAALSDDDIAWYVSTGEPLDKAGAYGIQGLGAAFVSSIDGSYGNVVGLPLVAVRRLLGEAGVDLFEGVNRRS